MLKQYSMDGTVWDTDLFLLNLPNRLLNALQKLNIHTIDDLIHFDTSVLFFDTNNEYRSSVSRGMADQIVNLKNRILSVRDGWFDLGTSEMFLLYCCINRPKVIQYFAEKDDCSIEELPFSTHTRNIFKLNGYRRLSEIIMLNPEDTDLDLSENQKEKIYSVLRYYLRDQKNNIIDYCENNTVHEISSTSEDTANGQYKQWSGNTRVTLLGLSVRTTNCLMRSNIKTLEQLINIENIESLEGTRGLGRKSLDEIISFLEDIKTNGVYVPTLESQETKEEWKDNEEFREFLQRIDYDLVESPLSFRAKNALISSGISTFSELLEKAPHEINAIRNIGSKTRNEIVAFRSEEFERIKNEFEQYTNDKSAYIQSDILALYKNSAFKGYSYKEFRDSLPEYFSDDEIKEAVGKLIGSGKLEYVDFRCYKVYPSFYSYLDQFYQNNSERRAKDIVYSKLRGETLEMIGQKEGITRERVRQLMIKEIKEIRNTYIHATGNTVFDEDYYGYLFERYIIDRGIYTDHLGVSDRTYEYLRMSYVRGKQSIEKAAADENVGTAIKLKLLAYLDKDKIKINGVSLNKKRPELVEYVISEYCQDDTVYDDFVTIYNRVLRENDIPDEKLYIDQKSQRTYEAYVAELDTCLWKNGRKFRYYDIKSYDYTDLLDTLDLSSFHNTEISTLKFFESYPETMKMYDIRDQYELHNLLKKIIDTSLYDDFSFGRQPVLKFGTFDRDATVYELLSAFSPISQKDLINYIHDEYGYGDQYIQLNILPGFAQYNHFGVYSVDFQKIPEDRIEILKNNLTEDFYYISEIQNIYKGLFDGADVNDINPYSLKSLGLNVYGNYAIQNYENATEYFKHLLTENDMYDITDIKAKYGSVHVFQVTYFELRQDFELFEFERNQIFTWKRLQKLEITKENIKEYLDDVYDFEEDNEFFTVYSMRKEGFSSPLEDLGLDDYFYWNLMTVDNRFGVRRVGKSAIISARYPFSSVSIKAFLLNILDDFDSIETEKLLDLTTEQYGIVLEKQDILNSIKNTSHYYDSIMDKIYRDKRYYYAEFDD